jgi:tetraacyldisaccharide 4'-kinase
MCSVPDPNCEIVYPPGVRRVDRDGRLRKLLRPALIPVSWVYQAVSNAVRSSRAAGLSPGPAGVVVVSVGNIDVGGSGKTPLAIHLLESITAAGGRPVYISRGFGGVAERLGVVTIVPGVTNAAAVAPSGGRVVPRTAPGLARQIGDEGAMVARRLPDVPLVLCRDKSRALEVAAGAFAPTHAVLDDAFQSWNVPRDVDVVVVDGERPFGDGWLLPAGSFREPPQALARADVIGLGGVENEDQLDRARGIVAGAGIRTPSFGIRRRIEVVPAASGVTGVEGSRCAVVCAIGRPDIFERQLTTAGLSPVVSFRYPDHHTYSQRDLEWISLEVERRGVDALVTTEKDMAKLADLGPPLDGVYVARLSLELLGGDILEDAIVKAAE